ncbi:hypothetical protein [Mesorhizobium xinjiangense]|uniref:hypothetical protein n=1 Tax=Mesorhizobium xinjiangense TaxID=2678685 RepID=UPI0012EE3133|nr:hypothetical protein [Mesorhizobium xinjiangense]
MLKDILARIDARLEAVGLTESAAAKQAGLSNSAIRDIRRTVKAGSNDRGVSTRTLVALAPILQTTASWLLEECGPEVVPKESQKIQQLLLRAANASPEVRAQIEDYAEFLLSNYEKSRATAT